MAVKFSNNFSTVLVSSISSSATVIELQSVSGLPTLGAGDYTYLTFDTDTNSPTIEIVKVTAINTGTNEVTVVRGQDNTSASAFAAGTAVELRLSAILLNDVSDEASVTDWGDILNKPSLLLTDGDGSNLTDVRAETVEVNVKNVSGGSLAKGTPVHQTGTAGAATFEVVAADASNAALMPAHFVLLETLADEEEGRGLLMGRISGVDTSSFSEGDTIYVAAGGGYTNTAPTGEGNLIQNLGTVTRVDATNGGGEVMGAGRSAATPNLNDGNIFLGNASNQAAAASLSTSVSNLSHYNNANWDTAYGWGNHASVGYLTGNQTITLTGDVSGSGTTSISVTIADDSHNHVISNVDGLQAALDAKQNASTALTTSTTFGGDVSGTYNAIVVANDSHTHDGRYYTESEINTRIDNNTLYATDALTSADDLDSVTDNGFYRWTSSAPTNNPSGTYHNMIVQNDGGQPTQLVWGGTGNSSADLHIRRRDNGTWKSWTEFVNSSTQFGGDVSGTYDSIVIADDSHNHVISNVDGLQSALDDLTPTSNDTFNGTYPLVWVANDVLHSSTFMTINGSTDTLSVPNISSGAITSTGTSTFSGIRLNNSNTSISQGSSNALRIQTNSGYVDVGPKNTNWTHFDTDRGKFYFAQDVHVSGQLYKYDSGTTDTPYWHAGNHGSGSGLDADLLDSYEYTQFNGVVARYRTTGSATGRIRITLPLATNSARMLKFTISQLSGYAQYTYEVSGYLYPTNNNWYLPRCVYTGTGSPDITVGRDANGKAYVSIANGNYTGIIVHSVTGGYQGSDSDGYGSWTIAENNGTENSVSVEVHNTWTSRNDGSGSGLDADLLDGVHGSSFLRSDAADSFNAQLSSTNGVPIRFVAPNATDTNDGKIGAGTFASGLNIVGAQTVAGTGRQVRIWGNVITDGGNAFWHSANDGSGSGLDADTLDGAQASQFVRADSLTYMSTSGIGRTDHHLGHLVGSYNNVGANSAKSNPIYSIGTDYLPAAASTGNHYGVGYSHSNFWGTANGKPAGWGMYVTEAGIIRGIIGINGTWSQAEFNRNGNKVWDAGNDGSGSGLDADLLDGVQGSSYLRSDASDSFSGTLTSTITAGSTALNLASVDAYASFRVIQNKAPSGYMADGMYIGYENSNGGLTRIYGGGATGGGLFITGSGANDLKYNNASALWHAGNDGSGSGLDADLFDGQDSTLFLRKRSDLGGSQNLNSYTGIGFYHQNANSQAQSGSNYPSGNAGMLTVTADGAMVYQTYHQYSGNAYYHRSYYNGTWYPWRKVWTDGNDGSGSGLDADLLDGEQGSNYLRSNVNDTFDANYLAWPTLNLSISNNNSDNGYNTYFRGSQTHFVLGLASGNTFYCNYGNTAGSFRAYGGNFMWNDASVGSPWGTSNDGSGSGLDADLLDGAQGSSYMRKDTNQTLSADINAQGDYVGSGDGHRDHGVYGNYNSYRIHHMWSMGTSYRINSSGANFGNLYGFAYTFSNRVYTSNSMAGSHQAVWCINGVPKSALGSNIWTAGNVTAYSDRAVKTNLEVIPEALDKVCQINGYTYDRTDFKPDPKTGEMPNTRQAGVVAQEVEKVLPEVVSGEEGGKAVAYGNMVGLLIEAIKELKAEVDDLKAQLEEVK